MSTSITLQKCKLRVTYANISREPKEKRASAWKKGQKRNIRGKTPVLGKRDRES
uniref:Uncharacterized protein n=1 Tax=Rhizophora mucronata TaxID=61149 RepID=A0A2P2QGN4_RHIMU